MTEPTLSAGLASRVLAAIEEAEQNRWRVHDQECDFGSHATDLMDLAVPSAVCDCPEPDRIARRCATDRKILAIHLREYPFPKTNPAESYCVVCDADSYEGFASTTTDSWCETVRLVAEGYGITGEETP